LSKPAPKPDQKLSLRALQAIVQQRSPLAGLEVFHAGLGPVFQATLPGFRPIMLAGAEANHFVLVKAKQHLLWRAEHDPITRLLGQGLLVADDATHDDMRRLMQPALHRTMIQEYVRAMWECTDAVVANWPADKPVDMLTEMRRVAMLIIMKSMFQVDFSARMAELWRALLRMVQYISPGLWVLSAAIPRPGYARALRQMEAYVMEIIATRRALVAQPKDLLGMLLNAGVPDTTIRDQMMTMIVAGHDTSTGMLSWALYLLAKHPDVLNKARAEVDAALGETPPSYEKLPALPYLGQILEETMRLYPPAHLGSRIAADDLEFAGYAIPKGERLTYSIYVAHRMAEYWPDPTRFDPGRFALGERQIPYSYVPFGGGNRNCIGALFAQVQGKVVLARLLQRSQFALIKNHPKVHLHMAVTIEPRPGVFMQVTKRANL
jgi:cytochrome P450